MRTQKEILDKIAEWEKVKPEMESVVGISIVAASVGTLKWVLNIQQDSDS